MKIQTALAIFIAALLSVACATTSKVKVEADSFAGGMSASTDPLPMVASPTSQSNCGGVDVCITFKKNVNGGTSTYEAVVSDGGEFKPPVNALKTDSLSFNVDGTITSLSTEIEAKSTEIIYGGVLSPVRAQTIPYARVPESLIQSLASAKEVKVRLKGVDREKVGYLRPISFEALQNLLVVR